jgi:type I restriction enzyme M protein
VSVKANSKETVTFLNPKTCGIYKSGGMRFKTDPATGRRSDVVDNELIEYVDAYLAGKKTPGQASVKVKDALRIGLLVPTYYDQRYNEPLRKLLKEHKLTGKTIGELLDERIIIMRGGHGSPGNDQRLGSVPYIKVSDIRALRVNVNPTNLVSEVIARRFWRGKGSGLKAYDLITPNRASNNIGEFAIILPGEEQIVVTKEVFVFRVVQNDLYDPFYLLWALSLKAVRDQWRRIALMQTNREDCGDRYREIIIPQPPNKEWAQNVSAAFRDYFTTIAKARETFNTSIALDKFTYVATASSYASDEPADEEKLEEIPEVTEVISDVAKARA